MDCFGWFLSHDFNVTYCQLLGDMVIGVVNSNDSLVSECQLLGYIVWHFINFNYLWTDLKFPYKSLFSLLQISCLFL